ncbi:hypothetical protein HMPREF9946_04427 [Acetobacteraceae bacterium AT-5844]|nr:hypothetical protein HMPREF9946_04427 [Acetobacteraceae bacterium AT-5844]
MKSPFPLMAEGRLGKEFPIKRIRLILLSFSSFPGVAVDKGCLRDQAGARRRS